MSVARRQLCRKGKQLVYIYIEKRWSRFGRRRLPPAAYSDEGGESFRSVPIAFSSPFSLCTAFVCCPRVGSPLRVAVRQNLLAADRFLFLPRDLVIIVSSPNQAGQRVAGRILCRIGPVCHSLSTSAAFSSCCFCRPSLTNTRRVLQNDLRRVEKRSNATNYCWPLFNSPVWFPFDQKWIICRLDAPDIKAAVNKRSVDEL